MNWQQIYMIVYLGLVVGIGLAEHGKPKKGYNNFWFSLIGAGIIAAVLYTGGFWE